MNRYLLLPLALGAVACEAPPAAPYTADVFWVQIIDDGTVCPETAITQNFAAEVDDLSNTFGVTSTTEESTGGEYMYVTRGENGAIFANLRGEVLTGTENNNGSIEVSWTNDESTTDTIELDTFFSALTNSQTIEQTMTLRPNSNEENPEFSGSYSRRDFRLLELTETDEWSFNDTGVGSQTREMDDFLSWTAIPQAILDNDFQRRFEVWNRSFSDDCPLEDQCSFRLEEDCTRQFTVEAIRLEGADIDDFDAIDGFGQPNGVE